MYLTLEIFCGSHRSRIHTKFYVLIPSFFLKILLLINADVIMYVTLCNTYAPMSALIHLSDSD